MSKTVINTSTRAIYAQYKDGGVIGRQLLGPGVNLIKGPKFKALSAEPGFMQMLDDGTLSMDKADIKEAKAHAKEAEDDRKAKAPKPIATPNSKDEGPSLQTSIDGAVNDGLESSTGAASKTKGKK